MWRWDLNRREFLKITAGTCASLAMPMPGQTTVSSKMVGIQVGAVSFVDEGTEKVLDLLQERACVNTLFLAVFTYGRVSREDRSRDNRCRITASRSTISTSTGGTSPPLIPSTTQTQF